MVRELVGDTQMAFGRRFGGDNQTISRWERNANTPSTDALEAIAAIDPAKRSAAWIHYGDTKAPETTLDRSTADEDPPTDQDELITRVVEETGIGDEGARKLRATRRSIGPMTRAELYNAAEAIARNLKAGELAFPKVVDRTEVVTRGDMGLRKTSLTPKRRG